MYDEPIAFMVGSTNMYGGIFYQMYILLQLTIPSFFKLGAMEF